MKDICIVQENSSRILADIGIVLGKAKVNIEGLSHTSRDGIASVHFLVNDEEQAIQALAKIGIVPTSVSEVFVFDKDAQQVTGKFGSFGQICQLLVENNLTIKFGYPAENNRFVFGLDDIQKATQLITNS